MLNRHGLVAGATGTGKTKTLQLMAEQLSAAGVPVFAADIKGDLSGISVAGEGGDKIVARAASVGQTWTATAFPSEFYALGGQGTGIPLRVTMTAFGPTLLSKVLGLNDTQESSLGLIFHYADQNGLALLDLADLRAVIQYLASDEGKADLKDLGGLSSATAGVLLRELIAFSDQGADAFFGEPEFQTTDFLRTTADGKGMISLIELPNLQDRPAVFSTFLMWLLADLFHDLPEVGDVDKPKLVFFFDEAHLLFADASKAFLQSIAQTVRLIRSKGVGVFFVTQSPTDVPDDVLAQLGSRIQHQLRAHTPNDAKALQADGQHLPHLGVRRPRRGDHQPGHRRGDRDRDERAWCADAGGVDPAARARVADGRRAGRRHGGGREGVDALRQVRHRGRPRLRARAARAKRLEAGAEKAPAGAGGRRPGRRAPRRHRPSRRPGSAGRRAWSRRWSAPRRSVRCCARPPPRSCAACSRPVGADVGGSGGPPDRLGGEVGRRVDATELGPLLEQLGESAEVARCAVPGGLDEGVAALVRGRLGGAQDAVRDAGHGSLPWSSGSLVMTDEAAACTTGCDAGVSPCEHRVNRPDCYG